MNCNKLSYNVFKDIKGTPVWLSENEGFRVFYQILVCLAVSVIFFDGLAKFTFIDYPLPYSLGRIADRILLGCCVLQLIVLIQRRLYKTVIFALAILVCGYLPYRYHGTSELYQLSLIAIVFSGFTTKRVLSLFLVSSGFVVAVTIICYLGCFYEQDYLFMDWGIGIRRSFGFDHPNVVGCVLLFFILTLWCRFQNLVTDIVILILLLGFIYLCHYYIISRTSEYTAMAAVALVIYGFLRDLTKERFSLVSVVERYVTYNLVVSSFVLFFVLFVVLSYFYDPSIEILNKLNVLLSTRLELTHRAISEIGFSVIGKEIPELDVDTMGLPTVTAKAYFYLDSLYAYLPIRLGVIPLIVYIVIHIIVVRKTYFSYNNRIALAMFLFAVHGLCEHMYLFSFINILPALYLSLMVNSDKNVKLTKNIENGTLAAVNSTSLVVESQESIEILPDTLSKERANNNNKKKTKKKTHKQKLKKKAANR